MLAQTSSMIFLANSVSSNPGPNSFKSLSIIVGKESAGCPRKSHSNRACMAILLAKWRLDIYDLCLFGFLDGSVSAFFYIDNTFAVVVTAKCASAMWAQ